MDELPDRAEQQSRAKIRYIFETFWTVRWCAVVFSGKYGNSHRSGSTTPRTCCVSLVIPLNDTHEESEAQKVTIIVSTSVPILDAHITYTSRGHLRHSFQKQDPSRSNVKQIVVKNSAPSQSLCPPAPAPRPASTQDRQMWCTE
jgi:hypothetical protein